MKFAPLSCKKYCSLNGKSAVKSFLPKVILHLSVFTALVFSALICFLLSSCSANNEGSGSLTIAMPTSSSSRSVSSTGSFQEEFAAYMTFSVYIRDEDNVEIEKYTGITPGTTLTIDQLRAGTYNIAIRGIADGDYVGYYGATEALVKGGTENSANIKMEHISESNYIDIANSTGVDELSYFTAKITCKNGDSWLFNYFGVDGDIGATSPSGSGCIYYHSMDNKFFEPGFTYTMDFTLYGQTGEFLYNKTVSAKATKNGILFTVD
ncbi:MAG: hypothetical protein J5817_10535 [Treponema sp.]|nr:hypothetical protein [Treponema sp.]